MSDAPFDVGLQPERTLLAWRRTCLALGVAAMLIIKLGTPSLGVVAGVVGLASLALGAGAYAVSTLRYRRVHAELTAARTFPGAGTQIGLIALGVILLAVVATAWVISGAL